MIGLAEHTPAQVQSAYKFAVKASLIRFYARTEADADALVRAWWDRILSLPPGQEDLYLHDEAITTAADLAGAPEVPVTAENQVAYEAICEEAESAAASVATFLQSRSAAR